MNPHSLQTSDLALKAAFSPHSEALACWEALRARHAHDELPDEVARLCGRIYVNLRLPPDHIDHRKLKGVYTSNFLFGNHFLRSVGAMLQGLRTMEIPYVIVKGGAVALQSGSFGVRRMGDIDVAVPTPQVDRVLAHLHAFGFRFKIPPEGPFPKSWRWASIGGMTSQEQGQFDLISAGRNPRNIVRRMLAAPVPVSWMGQSLSIPEREHTILFSLLHGIRGAAVSDRLQSLADFALLEPGLSSPKSLLALAKETGLEPLLRHSIHELRRLGLLSGAWEPYAGSPVQRYVGRSSEDDLRELRAQALRRQGRYRRGRALSSLVALLTRWNGIRVPPSMLKGLGFKAPIYYFWLAGFRMAVFERLLLRLFGSFSKPEAAISLEPGSIVIRDVEEGQPEARFFLPSIERAGFVLVSAQIPVAMSISVNVYVNGIFRARLPLQGEEPFRLPVGSCAVWSDLSLRSSRLPHLPAGMQIRLEVA